MPWSLIKKWVLNGLPVIILVIVAAAIYNYGSKQGAADVQAAWNADKLQHVLEVELLQERIASNESLHRAQTAAIADDLAQAEANYARQLASIEHSYALRLRNSADRGAIYERMSSAGAAERSYLASHAAELDRSLEQGRRLVGELRSTLIQRDEQLRRLGEQLHADRQLMEEGGETPPE
jgi:hypothetical protein